MITKPRKPTYGAAIRLARIALVLASRPYGWSFAAIQRELRISERTLLRYLSACREQLVDWSGRPVLQIVKRGTGRWLRLADQLQAPRASRYRAGALYFMLTQLEFLKGTIMKESAEDVWESALRVLPTSEQALLRDFDRKFFAVPYAPKNYREHDDQIDLIFRSVIGQNTLRIDYAGLAGEGKIHDFDPYTLAAYRGGLYLIGFSRLYRKIIYLAVERIRKAELVADSDRNLARFAYPKSYRPEKHLDGSFGLLDGPDTEVELLLLADSEAYLRSRIIHPTQRFHRRRDGSTVLSMRVRGTTELRNFILGFGPWIKVLKPLSLRNEVARLLGEAAALYNPGTGRKRHRTPGPSSPEMTEGARVRGFAGRA